MKSLTSLKPYFAISTAQFLVFALFTALLLLPAKALAEDSTNITSFQHLKINLKRHLTLPPVPGNPRNSEGDFIQLKDGRLLFIYTHFTGGAGDHAKAFLASRESHDDGKTWTHEDRVVVKNEGAFNVMSVSLLRLQSGEIALFYLRKNSVRDCRPVLRISRDEAQTWSEPIECIHEPLGYYVLNNNRVIQLANGRLIMPTALHDFENGRLLPGKIVVFHSDDKGHTWAPGSTTLDSDLTGTRQNLMEPGVVELSNNHLLMLIRTKLGAQFMSESSDHGQTWTAPKPSSLLGPEAPATIARIPNSNDLLVIWNDHDGQPESHRRHQPPIRTPLAVAISKDGGKTWINHKLLETEPNHGYCYTALTFIGNRALIAYCSHPSPYGLETTQISSFQVGDLY
ncbi:MAG: sialidase family protein [Verrucomicrobiota bacterium]